MPARSSRILVIFPGALGDLILLGPTIAAFGRRYLGASMELMARMELARFAVGRMGIMRAHSIDRAEVSQLFAGLELVSSPRNFFGAFDVIHSFFASDHQDFRHALGSVAREVHFHPFRPPGAGHVAAAYLREIGEIAEKVAPAKLDLLPPDRAAAAALLTHYGIHDDESFFLILPGSGSPAKNWPAQNFIAVAQQLAPKIKSIAVLGPAEAGLTGIFNAHGIPILTGLEIGAVAALAERARAFVGNDSGISHLAAAAGASGIVIFGPTNPERWRPLGAVQVTRNETMAKISLEEVITALGRVLPKLTGSA